MVHPGPAGTPLAMRCVNLPDLRHSLPVTCVMLTGMDGLSCNVLPMAAISQPRWWIKGWLLPIEIFQQNM